MRRRTILKCALTLVLMLGIFFSTGPTALAAGEVTVQVKDVNASAGQTVTTELIMDGTFASFQGALIYDTDALTLENIEATSLISGSITMFNQDEITGKLVNGSFVSASASNAAVSGAVLTFTFSAGSNANGTYSFSIEQLLVYDEEGVQLTVNAVDTIVDQVTPYSSTQDSATAPTTNNPGTNTDSNDPQASTDPNNPDASTDPNAPDASTDPNDPDSSTDPNDPDASTDPNDPDASTDPNDPSASTDPNDSDSNDSDGNGLVIILLIIAAVVVVVIVLIVVRVKKKSKTKDDKSE